MKIPALVMSATLFLAGAASAQKPLACDAPIVQEQVKEMFYTQMLNNGRAARAERFADPYSGTPAAFQAGIERARSRLQPEIKLLETVDQGYHDQVKARLCQTTLVVADNRAYAVATRYFVQTTTDGSPKIATEFLLPGGGGAGSFNAMIAYFDHFYEIAFRRDTGTELPRKAPIPPAPATTDASSKKGPSAAEPSRRACESSDGKYACPLEDLEIAKQQLNQAYRDTMARLDQPHQAQLESLQRMWIKQRDGNCEETAETQLEVITCKTEATKKRRQEVADFDSGSEQVTQVQRPVWCGKAGTDVERMICADDGLSALDAKMYAAYKAAEASAVDKKAFYAVSRAWRINRRDTCTSISCIADAYKVRLKELGG